MKRSLIAAVLTASLTCVIPAAAVPAAPRHSAARVPRQSRPITVVPSAGLPAKVQVDKSNANLAIARYRGRYFLVFRTAKWQIADDNTRLYVISSRDQVHWRYEGMFTYGRDLREPRFLVWHKHLLPVDQRRTRRQGGAPRRVGAEWRRVVVDQVAMVAKRSRFSPRRVRRSRWS